MSQISRLTETALSIRTVTLSLLANCFEKFFDSQMLNYPDKHETIKVNQFGSGT